jgi:hypothetical protein
VSDDPGPPGQRSHDRFLPSLLIGATAVLAMVIVVVTGTTTGFVDLATLVLTVSTVAIQLAGARNARRRRR